MTEWIDDYFDKKEERMRKKELWENSFRNPKFLDTAWKKAQEAKKTDTMKMEEFNDLYDVKKDKKYVEEKKRFLPRKTQSRKRRIKK